MSKVGAQEQSSRKSKSKDFAKRSLKNVVNEEDVQKQVKETLARLQGGGKKAAVKHRREKRETVHARMQEMAEKELREKVNEEILAGLKSISERLRKTSEQFDYDKSAISQVTGYIDEIENILGKSSKGEMQEILTIYKRLLPQEQYVKLRGKTNKTLNSLDKAIKTENDLFYDKLRDLKLGSGPTDVLSLVGSVGGVGLGLTTADNKDERLNPANGICLSALYDRAFDKGIFVNAAKARKLSIFKPRNHPKDAFLLAIFHFGLKTDHIAQSILFVVLPELNHGIRFFVRMRIG